MATIRHETWIDAPIDKVFALLATPEDMSSWWDTQTVRQTDEGEIWEHTPGPEHGTVRMLVTRRERDRVFQWRCISTHDGATPASAWTGTVITFRLGGRGTSAAASETWAAAVPLQTVVAFSHEGWDEASRYFAFCNTAWAQVLQQLADKATEGGGT